mgnify:CR=1 FL=1
MALSFVLENAARDILSDALKDYLDDGVLELYDGAVMVVDFTIPDKAVMTSVNGLITIGALGPEVAVADGAAVDIAKFWTNAKGALVATANVGLAAATPSVVLDNTNILTGQSVTITSATITVPAGT